MTTGRWFSPVSRYVRRQNQPLQDVYRRVLTALNREGGIQGMWVAQAELALYVSVEETIHIPGLSTSCAICDIGRRQMKSIRGRVPRGRARLQHREVRPSRDGTAPGGREVARETLPRRPVIHLERTADERAALGVAVASGGTRVNQDTSEIPYKRTRGA